MRTALLILAIWVALAIIILLTLAALAVRYERADLDAELRDILEQDGET